MTHIIKVNISWFAVLDDCENVFYSIDSCGFFFFFLRLQKEVEGREICISSCYTIEKHLQNY